MLYIKTKVLPSKIQGLGLFADQFVPKGTLIWKFTPDFDQKFTKEQIFSFPESIQIYLAKYAWLSGKSNLYCLSADNGKYFNHSDNPNVRSEYKDSEEEVVTTAIKDIQSGEEITDNYSNFENPENNENILTELARKYNLTEELNFEYKN